MESGSTNYSGKNPSTDFKYFCQKTDYAVIKMVDPCETINKTQGNNGEFEKNI